MCVRASTSVIDLSLCRKLDGRGGEGCFVQNEVFQRNPPSSRVLRCSGGGSAQYDIGPLGVHAVCNSRAEGQYTLAVLFSLLVAQCSETRAVRHARLWVQNLRETEYDLAVDDRFMEVWRQATTIRPFAIVFIQPGTYMLMTNFLTKRCEISAAATPSQFNNVRYNVCYYCAQCVFCSAMLLRTRTHIFSKQHLRGDHLASALQVQGAATKDNQASGRKHTAGVTNV